jgi:C1A family cysteine protease
MGWLPDDPSFKDYTPQSKNIAPLFKKVDLGDKIKGKVVNTSLPSRQDLRKCRSPVEDQGQLGSCTANAGVGLVEYVERRAYRKHTDSSRLFLYKVTRTMLNFKGDTGAFLRSGYECISLIWHSP